MMLQLHPADESDIPVFTNIWLTANANTNFQKAAFGSVEGDEIRSWMGTHFLHRYQAQRTLHHLKVVNTETKEIVAVGAWRFPADGESKGGQEAQKNPLEEVKLPNGVNVSLVQAFVGRMMAMERRLIDSTCYELVTLATLPQFECRGAGTMVIRFGLERIEKEQDKKAWVKSTPVATKLYEKLGWRHVEELKLDLQPYGGEGQEIISFMCR